MPNEKRPTVDAAALNLDDRWDEFEHETISQPIPQATIDRDGNVRVTVHFQMLHWIGDKEKVNPQPVTHTMGWIVPMEKLWTVAKGCRTPYRSCTGRECGK